MATLRDKQIAALTRILNLNASSGLDADANDANVSSPSPASGEPVWKVLVFDEHARDIVSSSLRVNDLRAHGITVHLLLSSTRHPIPDVPVIYLVSPDPANLQIIVDDLSRSLYSPAYVNFLSSIPRPLLEDFASQIASTNTAEHLAQIYDNYLNFIVAEPDMFSLGINNAYGTLNSAQTSDQELDTLVDQIVSGLFSVAVTLGVLPVIRCPRGGAAELIAAKLDRRLRDHILNSRTNLFSGDQKAIASRPVLILVDRNVDLIPMLNHSWTYQSLIHDILTMSLNKITLSVPIDDDHPEKGTKKTDYDLTASDFFWQRNATLPFPEVAEDIDVELKKYEEDASEITRKTGTSDIDDLQGASIAAHLKGALSLLPELKERKALLSMHMNILKSLVKGIEDRKVHEFFQLEEEIQKQTKQQVMEVIKGSEKGSVVLDKLRYFLIWYLATENEVSRADLEGFVQALKEQGADCTPIDYVKTVRQLSRMNMISAPTAQPAQPTSQLFHGLSGLSSRVTDRFKDAGLGGNFEGLLSGIKNLVPGNKDLTLTKITEALMDPQNASSTALQKVENYLYFDPRSANARGTLPPASQARGQQSTIGRGIEASFGERRKGYTEAIVFPVGGGSYHEYSNLLEWAKRSSAGGGAAGAKRRVVYGSTNLLSATQFVTQDLARLGKEST